MSTQLSPLLAPMLSSGAMRAICDDATCLQHMLDFEAALARAEAAVGVVPESATGPIATACKAAAFDMAALAEAATLSGNLAIPLVKALTAEVARTDAKAAHYVHWGATSQDVIDTAAMLTLRAGIDALLSDLALAVKGFARLAREHRNTAVVARTWLQHALPMPFGLKLAGYAAALNRSRLRLRRFRAESIVLQFGGAAGTLAALGDRGWLVAEKLAEDLQLPLPDAPWHSHRDRLAEAASTLAILAGSCGKIARDVQLTMQTDVAEAFEPSGEGRGGSSTMPHKRNPVAAATALAASTMAPNLAATMFAAQVGDHERSAGPWHAEWPTLPGLLLVVSGALASIVDIAEGLAAHKIEVDKRKIQLDEPIKTIGEYQVPIRLHKEVTVPIKVVVEAEPDLQSGLLAHGAFTSSSPPMYGARHSGSTTVPSGCRPFSTSAAQIRGQASAEPFTVCTSRTPPPPVGR